MNDFPQKGDTRIDEHGNTWECTKSEMEVSWKIIEYGDPIEPPIKPPIIPPENPVPPIEPPPVIEPPAGVLFHDDFSSGDLSHSENGIRWAGGNGNVPQVIDFEGGKVLEFYFDGNSNPNYDAFSEQRFAFSDAIKDCFIQFNLYIPENYAHRGNVNNNNKFVRIWNTEYGEMRYGMSLRAGEGHSNSGIAWMLGEYRICTPQKSGTMAQDFITDEDLGKWMKVKMQFKSESSAGAGDGVQRLWKNDHMVGEQANLTSAGCNAPRSFLGGYLLGWANSGFVEDTYMYMDNVSISDKDL